jgi:hypothetical protein
LWEAVNNRCRSDPRVHVLFKDGKSRRRKVWISETTDRDPVAVRISIAVEKHVAAAIRTEMETGFAPTGSLTLINFTVTFDPNLIFRIRTPGMNDRTGAALTSLTMTQIHERWLAHGDYPK